MISPEKRSAPVFRWMVDGGVWAPVQVGVLDHLPGRWTFTFDADYLARGDDSWELDPSWLRVRQKSTFTHVGDPPPGVFADVALSGWSLEVARRHFEGLTGKSWGWWESLTCAPAHGFGALFVGSIDSKPDVEKVLAVALAKVNTGDLAQHRVHASSGAMGGERPKIAATKVPDAQGELGREVILKFSGQGEAVENVIAEATALTMASQLGFRVPRHEVMVFNGIPALCIDRFDRGLTDEGSMSFVHCVSAATALGLPPRSDVHDRRRSYSALRSKLKEPSDALELFRRIVLNAVVGNSDDHPWNHSLIQRGRGIWSLAPLYDVMPFKGRVATPSFAMSITRSGGRTATIANLVVAARELAAITDERDAHAEIERVALHTHQNWKSTFKMHAEKWPGAEDPVVFEQWRYAFEAFNPDGVDAEADLPKKSTDRMTG